MTQAVAPKCPRCQNDLRYLPVANAWVCDVEQISYPGNAWCTKCSLANELTARYCASCGTPLGGVTRKASFGKLVGYAYRVWRENPAIIVPTLLVNAASLISQTIVVTVFVGLISYLTLTGGLQEIVGSIGTLTVSGVLGGFSGNDVFQAAAAESLKGWLFALLPVIILTVLAWIVVQTIFGSLATSVEFSAYARIIRSRALTIAEFLQDGFQNWRKMLRTYFLVNMVIWGPLLLGYALLLFSLLRILPQIGRFPTDPTGLVGVLAIVLTSLLVILLGLVLQAVTIFTFPAVAFEGKTGFSAIASGFRTVRRSLGAWIGYGVLRLGLVVGLGIVAFFLTQFGVIVSALVSALIVVSLIPILHMLKTSIHAASQDHAASLAMLERVGEAETVPTLNVYLTVKVIPGFRRALGALARYVSNPGNLPFHFIAALVFFGAYFFGEYVSNRGLLGVLFGLGYRGGAINPALSQLQPPFLSVELFLHNWMVSIDLALAGAVFGLPTILALFFNGWLIGILRPLVSDLNMFLAAVLPHGIVEVTSFLISGSAGIRFGFLTAKALRLQGPERVLQIRNALSETTYIVLGLAPVYLIAGIIEGTITPTIMRMAGWLTI